MSLNIEEQADAHAGGIRSRLLAEHARDLSDAELDRCLSPCVLGAFCIRIAKHIRDTRGGKGLELTCLMDHAGKLPSVLCDAMTALHLLEHGPGHQGPESIARANSDAPWRVGVLVHSASVELSCRAYLYTLQLKHEPSGEVLLRSGPGSVEHVLKTMRAHIARAMPGASS